MLHSSFSETAIIISASSAPAFSSVSGNAVGPQTLFKSTFLLRGS